MRHRRPQQAEKLGEEPGHFRNGFLPGLRCGGSFLSRGSAFRRNPFPIRLSGRSRGPFLLFVCGTGIRIRQLSGKHLLLPFLFQPGVIGLPVLGPGTAPGNPVPVLKLGVNLLQRGNAEVMQDRLGGTVVGNASLMHDQDGIIPVQMSQAVRNGNDDAPSERETSCRRFTISCSDRGSRPEVTSSQIRSRGLDTSSMASARRRFCPRKES